MLMRAVAEIDVRKILPTVQTPSLVLSRPGDRMVQFEASAALAEAMPTATFRALPPGAHGAFDIDDSLATETLNFVCGPCGTPSSERVLATVLFTDIVGSTEQLSSQGDSRWRHQLDVHDQLVDRSLSSLKGRGVVKGVLSCFDLDVDSAEPTPVSRWSARSAARTNDLDDGAERFSASWVEVGVDEHRLCGCGATSPQ
jgi:hypothetical protein